jgi:hypothetical protein
MVVNGPTSRSGSAVHGSDFARNSRLILLSAFALLIGGLSTLGAMLLLAAIRLFTNLFYFQTCSPLGSLTM